MADGALTISLDGTLADDVRAAAAARGQSPEEYVREALSMVAEGDDLSWDEDMRRLEEPGDNIPLKEAFVEFRAKVAELRAQKNK